MERVMVVLGSVWMRRLVFVFLSFVFFWAGVSKALDLPAFGLAIKGFDLLPLWLVPYAAIGLVLFELCLGIGLAFGRRLALHLTTLLLCLFVAVLGYGVWAGLGVDCGCFGSGAGGPVSLWPALFRDLGLLVLVGYLYLWESVAVFCGGRSMCLPERPARSVWSATHGFGGWAA